MSMRYQAAIMTASYIPLKTPDAPTIGTATGGNTQVSVTFTAPANVGGGAITSYIAVAKDSSSGAVFTNIGASSPIVVTGLTNGNTYTVRVAATNAFGTGPASAASNSVTPIAITLTIHMWGAGGGANGSGEVAGGPGAYVTGQYTWDGSTPITVYVAGGGVRPGGGTRLPAGGGGASAISISGTVLAVAAGGGGSGGGEQQVAGGVGGALNGGNGRSQLDLTLTGGRGATTTAVGGADTSGTPNGAAGSGTTGGAGANSSGNGVGGGAAGGWGYGTGGAGASSTEGGGGGGGGYYGGGGGAYQSSHWGSGGGGGSSYTGGLTSASSTAGTVNSDAYNTFNATAPQTGNAYYGSNAAKPGWQANGGNGRVVIVKDGVATTLSYTGSTQTYTG